MTPNIDLIRKAFVKNGGLSQTVTLELFAEIDRLRDELKALKERPWYDDYLNLQAEHTSAQEARERAEKLLRRALKRNRDRPGGKMKLTVKDALALAVAANPHYWRGTTMVSELSAKEIALMKRAHVAVRTLKNGSVKVSVRLNRKDTHPEGARIAAYFRDKADKGETNG